MRIKVGDITIGSGLPFVLIAGPCVIESEEGLIKEAKELMKITSSLQIPFILKLSYDKANRSSIKSYRGPGLQDGLRIIKHLKEELDVPILVDIHKPSDAAAVAETADILQIPAFLCRQTDIIVAAALTGKPVNVKKGQFLSPDEVSGIIEKVFSTDNRQVMITERGSSFGYNNLVVDMRSLEKMKGYDIPIIFDATHSVQQPGGKIADGRIVTGGDRRFVPILARAATAVGINGLYMEVHPHPEKALSDAANQLPLSELFPLLKVLQKIDKVIKNEDGSH